MPRSALIVDDSRTALVTLSRLLSARGVRADTAESGPEALNYLRHNAHPGLIFLDHMMPGMDGFETLAALKQDARTAVIPVVMYTSREGAAYMGQALTRGAVAVLRKPIDPLELAKILESLDRRREPLPPNGGERATRAATTGVIRVPSELRAAPRPNPEPPAALTPGVTEEETLAHPRPRRWPQALLALTLLLPAAWFYQRYRQSEHQRQILIAENDRLRAEQRAAQQVAAAPSPAPAPEVPRAPVAAPRSVVAVPALQDVVAWALNRHSQYGWAEESLGDARLAEVRDLVAQLVAAGFRGSVRIETHIGEFCLARDEQGNLRVPPDTLAFTRCEVITYPPTQAAILSNRQSLEFTRFLAQQSGPVRVVVAAKGNSSPLANYPDPTAAQTAGEWNQVARLNQRVEYVLVPAP